MSTKNDATSEDRLDDPSVFKPVLSSISWCIVWKGLASTVITQAHINQMVANCNGDAGRAALVLGRIRAVGAAFEFLIGPLCGRLSDMYGRKVIMGASMVASMVGNMTIACFPRSTVAMVLGTIPMIALDTAFFAVMRAMLADVMSGKNIAQNAFPP